MRSASGRGAERLDYASFVRRAVPPDRMGDYPSKESWDARLRSVADGLGHSFGLASIPACDLRPEVLGRVDRGDYVIERLTLQTRPGVCATATLYRPRRQDAPAPGVLCVHGHWPWARIDPVVQTRCIGLARLGYVCLAIDAFGAGERAVEPGPGTYHGGLMGAALWTAGVPLIGLQVHDNRRAVDYLSGRPEVDPDRLAITGASGGGNQSLYAGALDDRLKAVVPVCGVGTYDAYLDTACCVCEVNPGGVRYARTADLLAMMAPRALLVVSASRDAPQFSEQAASRSIAAARSRFEQLGVADRIRHVTIDSGHDYNRPMREAMYGWLDRWLRDRGDGGPVPEPEITPEDPSTLRCYPDAASRPATIVTIPEFLHRESLERIAALPGPPDHREAWDAEAVSLKALLADEVLGGLPKAAPPPPTVAFDAANRRWTIEMEPEPGVSLRGHLIPPQAKPAEGPLRGTVLILDEEPVDPESASRRSEAWTSRGYAAFVVELRALGRLKPATPVIAGAVDHNEAEWGVWIGRPLLGQWTFDILQWMDVVAGILRRPPAGLPPSSRETSRVLHGRGVAGNAAILAAPFAPEPYATIAVKATIRLVTDRPTVWNGPRMGLAAPNLLKCGDFGRIAALAAPRHLMVVGGTTAAGEDIDQAGLESAFRHAREIYRLFAAEDALTLAVDGETGIPPG